MVTARPVGWLIATGAASPLIQRVCPTSAWSVRTVTASKFEQRAHSPMSPAAVAAPGSQSSGCALATPIARHTRRLCGCGIRPLFPHHPEPGEARLSREKGKPHGPANSLSDATRVLNRGWFDGEASRDGSLTGQSDRAHRPTTIDRQEKSPKPSRKAAHAVSKSAFMRPG